MARTILLFFTVMALGACAPLPRIPVETIPDEGNYAIVGTLSEHATLIHVATLAFGNEYGKAGIGTEFERRLIERMVDAIGRHSPGYRFVELDIIAIERYVPWQHSVTFGLPQIIEANRALALRAAEERGLAFVIVLEPMWVWPQSGISDPIGGSNQVYAGYGIYYETVLGLKAEHVFNFWRAVMLVPEQPDWTFGLERTYKEIELGHWPTLDDGVSEEEADAVARAVIPFADAAAVEQVLCQMSVIPLPNGTRAQKHWDEQCEVAYPATDR